MHLLVVGVVFQGLLESLKRAVILPGSRVAFPQEPVSSCQVWINRKSDIKVGYSLRVFLVTNQDISQIIMRQRLAWVFKQRQLEFLLRSLKIFPSPINFTQG